MVSHLCDCKCYFLIFLCLSISCLFPHPPWPSTPSPSCLFCLLSPWFSCWYPSCHWVRPPQTKQTPWAGPCLIHFCTPSTQLPSRGLAKAHSFLNEGVAASLNSPHGEQGLIAHPHYSPSLALLLMASCCLLSFLQCVFGSLPFRSVHFLHPKGIEFKRDSLSSDCFRSSSISKGGKRKRIS